MELHVVCMEEEECSSHRTWDYGKARQDSEDTQVLYGGAVVCIREKGKLLGKTVQLGSVDTQQLYSHVVTATITDPYLCTRGDDKCGEETTTEGAQPCLHETLLFNRRQGCVCSFSVW